MKFLSDDRKRRREKAKSVLVCSKRFRATMNIVAIIGGLRWNPCQDEGAPEWWTDCWRGHVEYVPAWWTRANGIGGWHWVAIWGEDGPEELFHQMRSDHPFADPVSAMEACAEYIRNYFADITARLNPSLGAH